MASVWPTSEVWHTKHCIVPLLMLVYFLAFWAWAATATASAKVAWSPAGNRRSSELSGAFALAAHVSGS